MAYIPLVLIVVILAWFVAAYNSFVRFRNQIKNAWHQIDVQLKRRYDLIPNLVEVVKDYMAYEQETLTKVIENSGAALSAKGPAAQAKAEGFLTETLKSLFAVVEKYPVSGEPERRLLAGGTDRRRTRSPSPDSSTTTR